MENINLKKMKLLIKEQQKTFQNTKLCYICKEKIEDKHATDKKYHKVRDHCHYAAGYRGATCSIRNLKYSVLKKFQ